MAIRYQAEVKGFIVGDVKMVEPEGKQPFFAARAGQEQARRLPDGSFEHLRNVYFQVLQFGDDALASSEKFVPGNYFKATGQIRDREYTNKEGKQVKTQDLIVSKIEIDPDRPQPKNTAPAVERTLEQSAAGEELDQAMDGSGPESDAADPEPSLAEALPERAQHRLPNVSAAGVSRPTDNVNAGYELAR